MNWTISDKKFVFPNLPVPSPRKFQTGYLTSNKQPSSRKNMSESLLLHFLPKFRFHSPPHLMVVGWWDVIGPTPRDSSASLVDLLYLCNELLLSLQQNTPTGFLYSCQLPQNSLQCTPAQDKHSFHKVWRWVVLGVLGDKSSYFWSNRFEVELPQQWLRFNCRK